MNAQELIRNRLQQELLELQIRNPKYSLRAYAKRVQIPAGSLSLILLGKRKISLKLGLRIADTLGFDPIEKELLHGSFVKKKRSQTKSSQTLAKLKTFKLSADQFKVIRDWHYYAILNLLHVKGFQPDENWIADYLGLKRSVVAESIQRLFDLKLLKRNVDGTWTRSHQHLKTSDGITNLSLQLAHIQELDLAQDALRSLSNEERDAFSMTFPMKQENLMKIKSRIREMSQKIMDEFCCEENADGVYQFQVQLYPLSKKIFLKKGEKPNE